jgi:hypothetical protein
VASFSDLCAARSFVGALAPATVQVPGPWSTTEVLQHCAQSIEMSLDGFPTLKPAFVRATIGRWVARRFLRRGRLGHGLDVPIPGAPALRPELDPAEAHARLLASIDRFLAHEGPLQPHFVFGHLDRASFDRMHALHLADHFDGVDG